MAKIELQFWKPEAAATAPATAGLSTVVHVLFIGAAVIATHPSMKTPSAAAEERVWYLPPPNTRPAQAASTETIRYIELAPEGYGSGLGIAMESSGVELEGTPTDGRSAGNTGADSTTSPDQVASAGADSIFTIIEVDTVAARLPESAAPRYPAELLEKRIEGQVIVQFVVDTTGRADPGSFVVVVSSHPEFGQSVRDALPGMRFSPARIGALKVRQLVELPFTFTIADPVPADSTRPSSGTKRPAA